MNYPAQGRFHWLAIVDVIMNITFSFPCITTNYNNLNNNKLHFYVKYCHQYTHMAEIKYFVSV